MVLTPVQHFSTSRVHLIEDEVKQEPIESLPPEIMLKIFSYLKPEELGRCGRVSRTWHALASDDALWKALYPAIAFGQKEWEIYFGDVGEEPLLPKDIHLILQSPCPFWPDKKVHETHLLTLIPQSVNGIPLTMQSLGDLVKAPREGNAIEYVYFNLGEHSDLPAPASHWVLMTADIIPGSLFKTYSEQKAIVTRHTGYQVPNILDPVTSILMEYARAGTCLYSDKPWTFTRCQEKFDEDLQLAVEGFSERGLCASYFWDYYSGVGELRAF